MKNILLSEIQIDILISKLITESKPNINTNKLTFGMKGESVKQLQQQLMNLGYLKTKSMKPTGYFGPLTDKALKQYNSTTVPQKKTTPVVNNSPCDVLTINTPNIQSALSAWKKKYTTVDTLPMMNRQMNKLSSVYQKIGIPQRTACEISYIQLRPEYMTKYSFIIDTSKTNKTIYLFDNNGKFIAKSPVMSGGNVQSNNAKVIAQSLLSWSERVKQLGFKIVNDQWVDATGKNRVYSSDLIYAATKSSETRFLPKGIYVGSNVASNSDYAGGSNNMLQLKTTGPDSHSIAQALHGYYIEKPRINAMNLATKVLSEPNDPKVSQEFINLLRKDKINLSQSYGCINLHPNFLPYLRKYGPNSFVFNIGETGSNYLVNNSLDYMNKMTNSEGCPSPQSVGAISTNVA